MQSLLVVLTSVVLIAALYFFFGRTLYGKALRATALNRVGARLVGIAPDLAGALTFTLAALLCAFSGVLIGPITTVYYDSGFLVSLKGFVGAIIGGLVSYPLAAAGALLVGLLESFASFWASAFKEVIVFTLIIPVLLWRSLTTHHHEEEERMRRGARLPYGALGLLGFVVGARRHAAGRAAVLGHARQLHRPLQHRRAGARAADRRRRARRRSARRRSSASAPTRPRSSPRSTRCRRGSTSSSGSR